MVQDERDCLGVVGLFGVRLKYFLYVVLFFLTSPLPFFFLFLSIDRQEELGAAVSVSFWSLIAQSQMDPYSLPPMHL